MSPETIAGTISTLMFAMGNVPMVLKAVRTRSLSSYSHAQLMTNGTASLIHWIYISGLPFGPIWFLHGFYTFATALMLILFLRYERSVNDRRRDRSAWARRWRERLLDRLGSWRDRAVATGAGTGMVGALRSVTERCEVGPPDLRWTSSPELTLS